MSVLTTGDQIIEEAGKRGMRTVEAYVEEIESLDIEVSEGQVESLEFNDTRGVGIRLFNEGRLGFAYTSRFSPELIDKLLNEAEMNARETSPDEYNLLPQKKWESPGGLDIYHPELSTIPLEEKIDAAMRIETAARKYDPRIVRVRAASYSDAQYASGIVNSDGIREMYRGSCCSSSVMCIASEEGESVETGWAYHFARALDNLKLEEVGEQAADKAISLLGATGIESSSLPVVFHPIIGTEFLQLISGPLTADSVQKGKSLFRGRIDEEVASEQVTVIDDGRMEEGAGAAPVDDEGVPTGRTTLIENGRLNTYLYDTYTAAREGRERSTGNGIRGSFKGLPGPRSTNMYLKPRGLTKDGLINQISEGLYIIKVMGMHTADPISGDFSVGVSGLTIDKGRFGVPVRGVTLAGNIIELLGSVTLVADDLTFYGSFGSPTFAVEGMTVSG